MTTITLNTLNVKNFVNELTSSKREDQLENIFFNLERISLVANEPEESVEGETDVLKKLKKVFKKALKQKYENKLESGFWLSYLADMLNMEVPSKFIKGKKLYEIYQHYGTYEPEVVLVFHNFLKTFN